jgi:hypothetical protein
MDDLQCTFPMEYFEMPPDRVISDSLWASQSVADEQRIGLVLWFIDHNSSKVDVKLRRECPQLSVGIWAVLSELASLNIFPKVDTCRVAVMRRSLQRSASNYFVMHIRALSRDDFKNPRMSTLAEIADLISAKLLMPCYLIGRGDTRERIRNQRVVDLLYEEPLSWVDTIELLHCASFFVGTDSGPRHLAAAVGTPLICLDHGSREFGPFCPAKQIISSYPLEATVDGDLLAQILADAQQLVAPRFHSAAVSS